MSTQSKLKKIKGNKQKLKLFRSKEPLKSVFMWGINYSMSQLSHVKRKPVLMDEDFKGYLKAAIENHQFNKEFMPSHYKFKEYAPMVFIDLRRRFEVDDKEYLESLTSYPPVRLRKGPKKKDSSLMLSHDRKFVIRIISNEDIGFIQNWLAEYHEHILQQNGDTLLSHLLGLYRLTVNDQHTHMVVMRNILYPPGRITRQYVLDGLLEKQTNSEKEKKDHHHNASGSGANISNPDGTPVQCDLTKQHFGDSNLISDEVRVNMPTEEKDRVIKTLKQDMMFLETCRITKFKLLLGLRDPEASRFKLSAHEEEMHKNNAQLYSEEEGEEDGAGEKGGPTDSKAVCFDTAPDSDEDEYEAENALLSSYQGNRLGPYGVRDRTDSKILYYVGVIDFYKRRSTSGTSGSKERKASIAASSQYHQGGGGGGGTGAGLRRDSSGTSPPVGGGAGDRPSGVLGGATVSDNKQLSSRLINTLSYCLV